MSGLVRSVIMSIHPHIMVGIQRGGQALNEAA